MDNLCRGWESWSLAIVLPYLLPFSPLGLSSSRLACILTGKDDSTNASHCLRYGEVQPHFTARLSEFLSLGCARQKSLCLRVVNTLRASERREYAEAIQLVCLDEVHMLNLPRRGAVLEAIVPCNHRAEDWNAGNCVTSNSS